MLRFVYGFVIRASWKILVFVVLNPLISHGSFFNLDVEQARKQLHSTEDVDRFYAHCDLAVHFAYTLSDSSDWYLEQANTLIGEQRTGKLWAYYAVVHSVCLVYQREQEQAFTVLDSIDAPGLDVWPRACYHFSFAKAHGSLGNYTLALEHMDSSLTLFTRQGDQAGIAMTQLETSFVYIRKGDTEQAFKYGFKALAYYEENRVEQHLMSAHTAMGIVYKNFADYDKAKVHFDKAMDLAERLDQKRVLSVANNNLGVIAWQEENWDAATHYYKLAGRYAHELNDPYTEGISFINLGLVAVRQEEYKKAERFYSRALDLIPIGEDKFAYARLLMFMGNNFLNLDQPRKALHNCEVGYSIGNSIESLYVLEQACSCLSRSYEKLGKPQKALRYYREYVEVRDSLRGIQKVREVSRMEMQYKLEQLRHADSLKQEQEKLVQQFEMHRKEAGYREEVNRTKVIAIGGGLSALFAGILFVLTYASYRRKKKSNAIISSQRAALAEHNKDMLDSLAYASRIQHAMSPDAVQLGVVFPQSFVINLPRDIVSGDFFWMNRVGQRVYFAVVDCTGHGVPGALVSMVGLNGLNSCLREKGLRSPQEILKALSGIVFRTFQSKGERGVKDGMDLALCCLDLKTKTLTYAGANNPAWIWKAESGELEELKANRVWLGREDDVVFQDQTVQLSAEDRIFLFTDGYQDQFGGPQGKKLKNGRFKKYIEETSVLSITDQGESLLQKFNEWKGEEPQIDDVCVLGIKIS